MRIVHCFRSPVGGIFRHVRDLVAAQVEAGHKVGIVCDSSTGGDFEDDLFKDMKPHLELGLARVPMQRHIGIGDLISAWRTFISIKNMQPDILHGHGAKGGVYTRVFGSVLRVFRSRVARLYSAHGGSLHYDADAAVGKVFFMIERVLARFTDHILFVSDYERQAYFTKVGQPVCPTSLVYNGVAEMEFEPIETDPGASDFLYIGMMRDLKGPDIFIDAIKMATEISGRSITATMVGDGDDRERYMGQVRDYGLADKISFKMPMPARDAFRLARIAVVPSRAEAMPYIVLEALAGGKSVIASRVGGIPEIFGAESPALINPDAHELADKMLEVLADEESYAEKMPTGAALKRRFSANTMATSIFKVYRKANVALSTARQRHQDITA